MTTREIGKKTLKLILKASCSFHPEEFARILGAGDKKITEVVILLGNFSSERLLLTKLNILPISSKARGLDHNHARPNAHPSKLNLNFLGKLWENHTVLISPYYENSWKSQPFELL